MKVAADAVSLEVPAGFVVEEHIQPFENHVPRKHWKSLRAICARTWGPDERTQRSIARSLGPLGLEWTRFSSTGSRCPVLVGPANEGGIPQK